MQSRKISSGVWLCLILFAFSGTVIGAFYIAAHHFTRSQTASGHYGIPSTSIRMVLIDLHGNEAIPGDIAKQIQGIDPGVVFLQQARGKSIPSLQLQLGVKFISTAYYPRQNLPDAQNEVGNIILSKSALEESRPIPNHMEGSCGVWASTVIDGNRFYLACLTLSDSATQADARSKEIAHFLSAWNSLNRPPIIVAADSKISSEDGSLLSSTDPAWAWSAEWSATAKPVAGELHILELHAPAK
jgi:hypothetical protein